MKRNIIIISFFSLLFSACGFRSYQLDFKTSFEIKDQKGKLIPNHNILHSLVYPTSLFQMNKTMKSDASGKAELAYKLWVDDSNIQSAFFMADTTQNLIPTNLLEISGYQPQPTTTQTLGVDTAVYYTVHIVRKSAIPTSLLLLVESSDLLFNKKYTFWSDKEEKIGAFDRTFKFKAYKSKPFIFTCYISTSSNTTTSGVFEGLSSTMSNEVFDNNRFLEYIFNE